MKKIITMMLAILISVSTISLKAAGINMGKPSNLAIETKDDSYNVTFKNSKEMTKIKYTKDIKIELDIKVDKKDWSSNTGRVLVKDYNNNSGYAKITLKKNELKDFIKTDGNNYSIRVRYANKNQKGDFSGFLTIGSVGIYKNASKWADVDLLKAQKLGLISEDMKKDMKKAITREEFAELLVKASEKANIASSHITDNYFKDTNNKYVSYAYSLNFMKGINNNLFMPKGTLKKEDMAVSIDRMLSDNKDLKENNIVIKDKDLISKYAQNAVNKLVINKILNLDNKNNFNPTKIVTREEAVVTILRSIA